MKRLAFHPDSEILPRMTEAEFEALKESIRATGLQQPIVLHEGKILDGRHRYDACLAVGVAPRFVDWKGKGNPAAYVAASAQHRNLSESQKAAAAVVIARRLTVEGKRIRQGNLRQNGVNVETRGRSVELAARIFNIKPCLIAECMYLERHAPALFRDVFDGKIAATKAKREHARKVKNDALREKAEAAATAPARLREFTIVTGDCLKVLPTFPGGRARLIFCDPPYNIGIDYGGGAAADLLPANAYVAWCASWFEEAHRLLTPDGSFWVLISDEFAGEYAVTLKRVGFTIRRWIKWYETFGVNCAHNFNRTSRHLLYCVKREDAFVFNPGAVTRASDRQTKYADKRAAAGGKLWDDVWGINPPIARLVDNAAERVPGVPTQLPLALVRPIVECASEPGDTVMDFFTGSGTTPHACALSGRKFNGVEGNPEFAELARLRVARAVGGQDQQRKAGR